MAASPQTSLDDSKCWRCDLGLGLIEGIIGYQWGVIAEGGGVGQRNLLIEGNQVVIEGDRVVVDI